MSPDRFGSRYRVLRDIGSGGMGEVLLVEDLAAGGVCALKRLKHSHGDVTPILRAEFEKLTRLRHPAVVGVYDFGTAADGSPFYTMEYVPGRPLQCFHTPGDWESLFSIGADIAHGLDVLHTSGIIHGDLKPSNVLVVPNPEHGGKRVGIRLVDFGMARAIGDHSRSPGGTSGFAAPEIAEGAPPSVASDLYALGATLYALACRQPHEKDSPHHILGAPDRAELEERGAPGAFIDLVLHLMAADPRARPRSSREVRRELESLAPAIRRSLPERLGSASLIGRGAELRSIEAHLGRTLSRSQLVVLLGSSGIGKSALLSEIAARASLAGHSVVQHVGPTLQAARSVLGELRQAEANERAVAMVMDRAVRCLIDSSAALPTVHIVDDAEQLDTLSRDLIRRALVQSPSTLWVMARDAHAPTPDDESTLARLGLVETIRLEPLHREAVDQMVVARLRESPPARLGEFLWDVGQGHPGHTIEALQRAAAVGALRDEEIGLVVDADRLEGLRVAPLISERSSTRLAQLSNPDRRVLETLSVFGPTHRSELERIAPTVDWARLAQLESGGFVRTRADGSIQSTGPLAIETLTSEDVRELHRAALETSDLLPGERFRHLRGAGDVDGALLVAKDWARTIADVTLLREAAELAEATAPHQAAEWHDLAAGELFRQGRYEAAIPHVERGLALEPGPEARPRRLYLLSSAYLRLGAFDRTEPILTQALSREVEDGMRSHLLTNDAARLHSLGDLEGALSSGRLALKLAEEADEPAAAAAAAQSLVHVLLARGEVAEAGSMADAAVHAADRAGGAFGRARAQGALAAVTRARRDPEQALHIYERALEIAREDGLRNVVEELLLSRSVLLCELGRWSEFRAANAEALQLALEDHRPRNAAVALANLAHADALSGQLRRARREASSAVRLARQHLPALECSGWRALAHVERLAGRLKRARRAARNAVELARTRASSEELGWCRLEHGRVRAAVHQWGDALSIWTIALDGPPEGPAPLPYLLRASCGLAALALNDRDRAENECRRLEPIAAEAILPAHVRAWGLRLRSELALQAGNVESGVRLAEEALTQWGSVPAPADQAEAAVACAERIAAAHSPAPARVLDWLREAAACQERLGNARGRGRALQCALELYRNGGVRHGTGRARRALFEAVSALVVSMSDLRELGRRAMQLVVDELAAQRGVFLVVERGSDALIPLACNGDMDETSAGEAMSYSRRVVDRAAASALSILIPDAPLDPRAVSESVERLKLRSILCTPLLAGKRVVGAVYLDDARRPRAFDEADQELMESIAQLLAAAIDRSLGQREMEETNEALMGENRSLRLQVATHFRAQELIGTSSAVRRMLPLIERASATNTTVLIRGESGTGKELIARIIHSNSKRRNKPFVAVNCGALTDSLVESELLGIRANVATGVHASLGYFRQADGGTLFLDEIGEMPPKQQVILFRAIANREIASVGGGRPIPIDIQLIAATNRDLEHMVGEGSFREELYYRVNVFPIDVPPLRDRKADIEGLARHFIAQIAAAQAREVPRASSEFISALMRSDWPGNIRELQNYIERVMAVTPGSVLYPKPLPADLERRPTRRAGPLPAELDALEHRRILEALAEAEGNQTAAARLLGVSEPRMRRLMHKHGLPADRQKRRLRSKRRPRP
jgi:transcriptional regulator with GAF, ATPase, and Fis domain/tetratricopeptide (TPR) repeat protein/predicted ATPase